MRVGGNRHCDPHSITVSGRNAPIRCLPTYSKTPHEAGAFGNCSFIFFGLARVCMGERSPLLYISRHVVTAGGVQTCRLTDEYDVKVFA